MDLTFARFDIGLTTGMPRSDRVPDIEIGKMRQDVPKISDFPAYTKLRLSGLFRLFVNQDGKALSGKITEGQADDQAGVIGLV